MSPSQEDCASVCVCERDNMCVCDCVCVAVCVTICVVYVTVSYSKSYVCQVGTGARARQT